MKTRWGTFPGSTQACGRRHPRALTGAVPLPREKRKRRRASLLLAACVLAAVALALHLRHDPPPSAAVRCVVAARPPEDSPDGEAWSALAELLAARIDHLAGGACIELPSGEAPSLTVRSSIDPDYQARVDDRMRRSLALAGAAVVLHPASGRVLALSVYNADPAHPRAHFWKAYPAASVFKMVTAAAALDSGRLSPDSLLAYTGRPHTLYRRQLQPQAPRWSHPVTLEKAFAGSINPVFGKIGIYDLGAPLLEAYASAFFFNQPPLCEIPVETSVYRAPATDWQIAELSSGFNRETLVTPVQAAWLAAVVAAGGAAPFPWIVDSLEACCGQETPSLDHQRAAVPVLSAASTRQLQRLMEATIRYGTCRRSFARRKTIRPGLPLTIGGKTGNINDRDDRVKYDWFVGYALAPDTGDHVALSVLMLHGEKLGHRANAVAFDLMQSFYRQQDRARRPPGPLP